MHPAIRTQADFQQDAFSADAQIDCSEGDMARQEFRDEADVNYLLSRYGVDVPVRRNPSFGDVDFDLDLHSAYVSVDRVDHALRALPAELREQFGTRAALLDGMNSGELDKALRRVLRPEADPVVDPAPVPAPVPPVADPS